MQCVILKTISEAGREFEIQRLLPFQILSSALATGSLCALPFSATCAALSILPSPSSNASLSLKPAGATNSECANGTNAYIIDDMGSETAYVILTCVVMMAVVLCSRVHGKALTQVHRSIGQLSALMMIVSAGDTITLDDEPDRMKINDSRDAFEVKMAPTKCLCEGTDTPSVAEVYCSARSIYTLCKTPQIPCPSKVVKKSEDSGCVEDPSCSVSTTRGDDSSSKPSEEQPGEKQPSEEQHGEEQTGEQQHAGNIDACIEISDDHEPPRFCSIEVSRGDEVMRFQHVNAALPCQRTGTPPGLPVVTGKSGATRRMISKPPPRPLPNSTWAEESTGGNPNRRAIPAVPPAVVDVAHNVLQVHSGSGGGWAEEEHESGHTNAINNLDQESSHHEVSYTSTPTTSSVGEPPPDEQEVHDEQDISVVTAGPDNCLFIQQMAGMQSQPQAQPEVLCVPAQESEAGRNQPTQLVP